MKPLPAGQVVMKITLSGWETLKIRRAQRSLRSQEHCWDKINNGSLNDSPASCLWFEEVAWILLSLLSEKRQNTGEYHSNLYGGFVAYKMAIPQASHTTSQQYGWVTSMGHFIRMFFGQFRGPSVYSLCFWHDLSVLQWNSHLNWSPCSRNLPKHLLLTENIIPTSMGNPGVSAHCAILFGQDSWHLRNVKDQIRRWAESKESGIFLRVLTRCWSFKMLLQHFKCLQAQWHPQNQEKHQQKQCLHMGWYGITVETFGKGMVFDFLTIKWLWRPNSPIIW